MTSLKTSQWMLALTLVLLSPALFSADGAKQIIEEKCTLCHDAPDPVTLTKEEWVIKVDEMAPNAGLSTAETLVVLDYVSSLAKDAASVLSMGNEKKLFDLKCSLCHTTNRALIMPMTPESVNEIVSRMQKMAGDWITDDQAHEISGYLIHGAPESERPTRAEISPSEPYALFLQRCTACHTAEQVFTRLKHDKEGTTVANWPVIINRMQTKAPNWITKKEAADIIHFLKAL